MAARVLAAFGNRSARRQAPSPLLLAPPRLADDASCRHPSDIPLRRHRTHTARALELAGIVSNRSQRSRRSKPAPHATTRQTFTVGDDDRRTTHSATAIRNYAPTSLRPHAQRPLQSSATARPSTLPIPILQNTSICLFYTTVHVDICPLR